MALAEKVVPWMMRVLEGPAGLARDLSWTAGSKVSRM